MSEEKTKAKRTRGKPARRRPGYNRDGSKKAPKKATKKAVKKDTEALADVIFADLEGGEEREEPEESAPKAPKTKKSKFLPMPGKKSKEEKEKEEEEKKPIVLEQGTHPSNAFVIQKSIMRETHSILRRHFGEEHLDYFIHAENRSDFSKHGVRRKYKIVLIEDKNGFKYNIWFDLTNLGALSY